jgi:hypothetical protein
MFVGLPAEIRPYGESLIIAGQILARLIPDVIKNTSVKVSHRLLTDEGLFIRTVGPGLRPAEGRNVEPRAQAILSASAHLTTTDHLPRASA